MSFARLDVFGSVTLAWLEEGKAYPLLSGSFFGAHDIGKTPLPEPFSFLAPIEPVAVWAVGLNYASHIKEMGKSLPKHPEVFMKSPLALQHPLGPIILPRVAREVDFEGELAVVIGKKGKNIPAEKALDHVLGYTCALDITSRDWQREGSQWVRAKSFDTFLPLGPVVVPASALDPRDMAITTWVNEEKFQEGRTKDMIFSVAQVISFLSESTTLVPGMVVLTGTPPGVGAGRHPPRWLKAGDMVRLEIKGIGVLEHPVVDEE